MLFNYDTLPDWNNIEVLDKNKLPPRSYFITYQESLQNKGNLNIEKSPFVIPLNGKWHFKYYESAMQIDEGDITCDIEKECGFTTADVPSVWQYSGVENPFYLNVAFPFPAMPPYIPMQNPAAIYRREFFVDKEGDCILTFLGVSSAFHVYVNGKEAGYSEGSHNTAEFDITSLISKGKNEICVIVYKWCTGSYLECQDMFRNNGIFRDVYLNVLPKCYIFVIDFITKKRGTGYDVVASVALKGNTEGCSVELKLLYLGEEKIQRSSAAEIDNKFDFFVDKPFEWNAETPHCYDLDVSVIFEGKSICNVMIPVGFKSIDTNGGVFKINGVPIKCKGVNHHDTHPIKGYALSIEDYERDFSLMKEFNINTVRFSHYPPHPAALELCTRLGLYVVDEADIECHGSLFMDEGADLFAEDKSFLPHFLDRTYRMLRRDKNYPCIIMWSIGNESGFGENHKRCYELIKDLDPLTPVHYEGAYVKENIYGFDVISSMYSAPEHVEQVIREKFKDKPYFLCEYGHAMGIGPGGLKEYWELFYSQPTAMGGCIWEWCDHSYLIDGKYHFGGDGGEYIHDGNFCVDGMMFPNREPSRSAFEIKNVYRPIISKLYGERLVFYNTQSFLGTSDFEIEISFYQGEAIAAKKSINPHIPPLKKAEYELSSLMEGDCTHMVIRYLSNGTQRGFEQHKIKEIPLCKSSVVSSRVKIEKIDSKYQILTESYRAVFDEAQGNLVSFKVSGKEMLNLSPKNRGVNPFQRPQIGFLPNVLRYGIDNDMYIKNEWKAFMLDKLFFCLYSVKADMDEGIIVTRGMLTPPKLSKLFEVEISYKFTDEGILILSRLEKVLKKELSFLPRFGVMVELDPKLNRIRYFGNGPHENYCDFLESSYTSVFETKVSDMCFRQIKPQEGGNRTGVYWAEVTNNCGEGLRIEAVEKPLNFNAMPYIASSIESFSHEWKIKEQNTTQLMIDGYFSGIGSNSCGPLPFEKYRVKLDEPLQFSFMLKPIVKK